MAEERRFVSRAGDKLDHALNTFDVDVAGMKCADFGCNVGGFTDCMLSRGAGSVVAIDTGRGALAWKLRQDPRVEVRERTNALHAEPPDDGVDLVTIDLAWTPQRLGVPAALRWLGHGGRIVSLIKPHYELTQDEKNLLQQGFLPHEHAPTILERVLGEMPGHGARVIDSTRSPLVGGKTARRKGVPGNLEFLALLEPLAGDSETAEKGGTNTA